MTDYPKDEVWNMEWDSTLQLFVLETPATIVAKFPDILEDQDWESLREEFYKQFPVSFLERIKEKKIW